MKILKKIIFIFLILFFNFSLFAVSHSFELFYSQLKNKDIIVACVENTGFIQKASPSLYDGYLVEYYNKLGEAHNIHFKYILAENTEACQELVNKGIADISCLQYKSEELEKSFVYSDTQMTILKTNLYTLAENDALYFDDFANFDGMTIGIRKDLHTIDKLYEYAKHGGFSFIPILYENEIELQQALKNKKVDTIATDYNILSESYFKQIGSITYDSSYIIAKKGSNIIDIINHSANCLYDKNSNIYKYLIEKNFQDFNSYIEFTRDEVEYISNLDNLRVGLLSDAYIQNRYDKKSNEFKGLIIDYMNEIKIHSNLNFEFVPIPYGLKAADSLEQNLCDITPYISRNEETLNNKNIITSINYINMKQMIAIRKNEPFTITEIVNLSCPANYQGLQNYILNKYPGWNMVKTKSNNILDPLVDGIVDVAIGNEYELKYLMQKPKYSDLFLTETYLFDILLSMGVRSDTDPRLLSIINKAIGNISSNRLDYFKLKGSLTNYQYTFSDSYFSNNALFNLIGILLISVIAGLLLFSHYQKKVNDERMEKEIELSRSNKKYEKASKAKNEFLASMSHDLRTPMNAIISLSQLSKNNLDNKKDLAIFINKIDISANYLLGLINDILDISVIEDGKLQIASEPFSLKDFTHELVGMFNVRSQQKNIIFTSHITDIHYETLIGDYYRIKQIVTNLLSNAFKFTPEGGKVELNIKEELDKTNNLSLIINVKDTGIGISKENQNKIFTKFIQAEADTLKKYGGSGLGLSIVTNLVNLMNGKISLESLLNQGSTFKISIPLLINNAEIENQINENNNTYSKYNILIIEDEDRSCNNIAKLITKLGAYCICVNNSQEALIETKKAKDKPFNICIIDQNILNSQKDSFYNKICPLFEGNEKYIIFCGYDISYLKNIQKDNNVEYYLEKPIFPSSVKYMLNNLSNNKNKQYTKDLYHDVFFDDFNVLLCEDNEINQLVGKKILEGFGCNVTIASNGKVGYETFLTNINNKFDVILMDIRMPELDGYETTTMIRNSNTTNGKTIPIFAMTANVLKEDIEKSKDVGMNGHIAKPIDNKKLYDILKKIWEDKKPIK